MRILFVTHHELDSDAGAAGVSHELARVYEGLGHHTSVFSFSDLPSRLPWHLKALSFPALAALQIGRRTRREGIDVVDASTGDAWVWSRLAASRTRDRPLLVTRSHGLEHRWHREIVARARSGEIELSWRFPLYHGGYRLWEVAQSLRGADLCLFLNRVDRDFAVARLRVDAASTAVLPNGLPDSLLGLPPPSTVPPQRIRIAQLGTFIERKGIAPGCAALNAVLRREPSLEVTFLGTMRPGEEVRERFHPQVRGRVEVIPRYAREELPGLLAGHQIVLFPTLFEGFGKALLEGMACGLAPVASEVPGPRDFIESEVNGLLVPPGDAGATERALERLIGDPPLRLRLQRHAHRTAQEYSWRDIGGRTVELYEAARARAGLARHHRGAG